MNEQSIRNHIDRAYMSSPDPTLEEETTRISTYSRGVLVELGVLTEDELRQLAKREAEAVAVKRWRKRGGDAA